MRWSNVLRDYNNSSHVVRTVRSWYWWRIYAALTGIAIASGNSLLIGTMPLPTPVPNYHILHEKLHLKMPSAKYGSLCSVLYLLNGSQTDYHGTPSFCKLLNAFLFLISLSFALISNLADIGIAHMGHGIIDISRETWQRIVTSVPIYPLRVGGKPLYTCSSSYTPCHIYNHE